MAIENFESLNNILNNIRKPLKASQPGRDLVYDLIFLLFPGGPTRAPPDSPIYVGEGPSLASSIIGKS